jgi:hypothetical protein
MAPTSQTNTSVHLSSADPDQGHDAHLPGGIVDQELDEPEIAELGHRLVGSLARTALLNKRS